jgi:hypothetical protein
MAKYAKLVSSASHGRSHLMFRCPPAALPALGHRLQCPVCTGPGLALTGWHFPERNLGRTGGMAVTEAPSFSSPDPGWGFLVPVPSVVARYSQMGTRAADGVDKDRISAVLVSYLASSGWKKRSRTLGQCRRLLARVPRAQCPAEGSARLQRPANCYDPALRASWSG